MSTYQSVQSGSSNNSGTVTMTKPVGLAVGDWLVAGVWADRDSGSSVTNINTPAGWTQEEIWFAGGPNAAMAIFSKVADAGDVAAANFTFTASGSTGNMHMIGQLARITGVAFRDNSTMSADGTSGAIITAPSVTQTYPSSLYLGFFGVADTGGIPATSTFGIATDNPTWTQQVSDTVNDGVTDSRLSFYTATRTPITATGTLTGNTTLLASNRGAVGFISLAARVDGSVTPGNLRTIGYVFTPIQSVRTEAEVTTPVTDSSNPTQWTNPDKGNTTWTNPDKP